MQGGVGDFTFEVAQAAQALGHTVAILTSTAVGAQSSAIPVQRIASPNWTRQDVGKVSAAANAFDMVNIQYQAAAFGPMRLPIHALPKRLNTPNVITFHDLRVPYLFPKAGPLRKRTLYQMAQQSNGVITTNPQDYAELQPNTRIKHLVDIPIGSNIPCDPPPQYAPQTWRANHNITPETLLVGYFGFLNETKGGETLLRGIAQLVAQGIRVKLLLIGGETGSSDTANNADYNTYLNQLAGQLGIQDHVIRTGFLAQQATSAALLACDVMAMPYRDGASFRRGTFMACLNHAKPTITTQPQVPLPQLQHGNNSYLIPVDDHQALSQALLTLQADPALREKLGTGAQTLSANFTWDKIAERTVAFFDTVLATS